MARRDGEWRCAFCGQAGRPSKEHLLAKWMRDHVGPLPTSRTTYSSVFGLIDDESGYASGRTWERVSQNSLLHQVSRMLPSVEIGDLGVVADEGTGSRFVLAVTIRCTDALCQDGLVGTDLPPVECLIIIDVQRGFVEGPQAIPGAARLIDRLSRLLTESRRAGALVVHLQNDGSAGAVDQPGTPGWELLLAAGESGRNEVILRKSSDDGFTGTGLGELLDSRGVRRVAIGGLLSEMCVSATARAALAHGLSVVVPRDAHGTYDLDEIPAAVVSRVAEHALGDVPELADSAEVRFVSSPG